MKYILLAIAWVLYMALYGTLWFFRMIWIFKHLTFKQYEDEFKELVKRMGEPHISRPKKHDFSK